MSTTTAGYFDGQNARRHAVRVTVRQDGILIENDDIARELTWDECAVSERSRHGPRLIMLPCGAYCEIDDNYAFSEALRTVAGHSDGWVVRLQQNWTAVLGTVAAGAFALVAGYIWGLPWLADHASRHVPREAVVVMSQQAMKTLAELGMRDSRLPAERQAALTECLRRIAPPDLPGVTLHFRQGGRFGANALALPSGDIVVTDELIELAGDRDDWIVAVMAHELGHVAHRHGLRNVLQTTIVGSLATLYVGDVSVLLGTALTAGLTLRYSREFEDDADAYAARLLRETGHSPVLLAEILEKLEADHRDTPAGRSPDAGHGKPGSDQDGASEDDGFDLLSTHPGTASRAARLRAL